MAARQCGGARNQRHQQVVGQPHGHPTEILVVYPRPVAVFLKWRLGWNMAQNLYL